MLNLSQLTIRRGPRVLFSDATFKIHAGHKVGITGANGCGKSSLFALIRGELQADSGDLSLPRNAVIAHVAQETPAVNCSGLDYVLDGDKELRELQNKLTQAEAEQDGHLQAELHAQMDAIQAYTANSRAARLLHGLGFNNDQYESPVSQFSGGWRMRLNLAQALMCRSDILLLDEPTNHLDLDAVMWLENWLQRYPGTLLLISHDRDFLDSVVGHIAHIEQQHFTLFNGNYSSFEQQRSEQLAQQAAAYNKQQREITHMQSYVDRFRAKATKARQAQSRLKALQRMTLITAAHVDSPFHFSFKAPEKLPNPLLQLDDTAAGYGDNIILDTFKFSLEPGARMGLLGPNGAGKSTLIKLLAGTLKPLGGERIPAKYLQLGYFAQHQLEQLDPQASALLHLQRLDKTATEQQLRDHLGGFGFQGDRVLENIAPFSGGEKARLVLALLVYLRPNVLLLDEPTNHLDLEMRLALSLALQEYKGAMVIVSHDRHMLRTVCDEYFLVHAGKVEAFDGNLDDYKNWIQSQDKQSSTIDEKPEHQSGSPSKKEQRRDAAQKREKLKPLTNKLKNLEKSLSELENNKTELESRLTDPGIYETSEKDKLKALLLQQAENQKKLDTVEEQWMEISEQLQALS